MPISLPRLFRALVLAALALHVFWMFSIARGFVIGQGTGELNITGTIIAASFAFAMLIPLIWAVAIPEMPEMYTRHVRARRWYFTGCCPVCGYRRAGDVSRCSECGCTIREPEPYRIRPYTVRLFIMMNLLAWIIGIGCAETWARLDERAFTREVAAHTAAGRLEPYTRPRWWPSTAIEMTHDRGSLRTQALIEQRR